MSELISRQAAIARAVPLNLFGREVMMVSVSELENLPPAQPVEADTNVGLKISKFIDGLEVIFADLRERHVDDSVCGLCEYEGAYMGQSGDWCNECPGFDRDDCFKLSDETRKKWTDEIIKALTTMQPERKKGEWIRNGNGTYSCSVCQSWIPEEQHHYARYCLCCGAKMTISTK